LAQKNEFKNSSAVTVMLDPLNFLDRQSDVFDGAAVRVRTVIDNASLFLTKDNTESARFRSWIEPTTPLSRLADTYTVRVFIKASFIFLNTRR